MKLWQVIYASLVSLGLLIGLLISPYIAIIFIWISIIGCEVLNQFMKNRKFKDKFKEFEKNMED